MADICCATHIYNALISLLLFTRLVNHHDYMSCYFCTEIQINNKIDFAVFSLGTYVYVEYVMK